MKKSLSDSHSPVSGAEPRIPHGRDESNTFTHPEKGGALEAGLRKYASRQVNERVPSVEVRRGE